jgi:hypothetical protein
MLSKGIEALQAATDHAGKMLDTVQDRMCEANAVVGE